jgi:hypothetical protein
MCVTYFFQPPLFTFKREVMLLSYRAVEVIRGNMCNVSTVPVTVGVQQMAILMLVTAVPCVSP